MNPTTERTKLKSPTPDRANRDKNTDNKKPPLPSIPRKYSLSQRYSSWNKIHLNEIFSRFESIPNQKTQSSREATPSSSSVFASSKTGSGRTGYMPYSSTDRLALASNRSQYANDRLTTNYSTSNLYANKNDSLNRICKHKV